MSKAMAIEGIMKLILMIAVLVVGMSFLLKAFGIDLLGWLRNMFGGFEVPSSGKILYAKMDPDDKQVFAFFITDTPIQEIEKGHNPFYGNVHTYFLPNKLDDKSCVIYTVKERDNTVLGDPVADKGYYYYVKPGALIQQQSCGSIGECIKDFTTREKTGCTAKNVKCSRNPLENEKELNECNSQLRGDFVVGDCGCAGMATCDDNGDILDRGTDRKVEKETFQNNYNFVDFCDKSKTTPKCNLLQPGEYNIKYGLLCADDGKWHTCKAGTTRETTTNVYNNPVTCVPDAGGDVYFWDKETIKLPATLTVGPSPQKINDNIIVTLAATDENGDLKRLFLNIDEQGSKVGKCNFYQDSKGQSFDSSVRTVSHDCSDSGSSCTYAWILKCSQPGTYKFQGQAIDSQESSKMTNVATVEVRQTLCQGKLEFTITPNKASKGHDVTFSVAGILQCYDNKITFYKDIFRDDVVASCVSTGSGCQVTVKAPSVSANYAYEATIDKDGDGKISPVIRDGESATAFLTVE